MPAAVDILYRMSLPVEGTIPGGADEGGAIFVSHAVLAADGHVVGTAPGLGGAIVDAAHVKVGSQVDGFAIKIVGAIDPGGVSRTGHGAAADVANDIIRVADNVGTGVINAVDDRRQTGKLSRGVNVKYAIGGIVPGNVNRAVPDGRACGKVIENGRHGYIGRW